MSSTTKKSGQNLSIILNFDRLNFIILSCPDPLLTVQFSALLFASYDCKFVAVESDAISGYLLIFGIGSPPKPGVQSAGEPEKAAIGYFMVHSNVWLGQRV